MLLMESTYGDRLHGDRAHTDTELADAITRTVQRRGKVVIPSFALERAQELILSLQRLRADKRIPEVPVYLDSPLSVRLTVVFRAHPECFDRDLHNVLRNGQQAFEFDGLEYVESPERSRAIDLSDEPSITISASGMCEFGRVVHHLKATIGDDKNTVIIVGFQAQHTLGRRLVERRTKVSIFGVPRPRNAEVVVLNGLSAHADRDGLLAFAEAVREQGPLRHVMLVHGEPPAQDALRSELEARNFARVDVPEPGQRIRL
jgi:metallo-beta-lactamase family protein